MTHPTSSITTKAMWKKKNSVQEFLGGSNIQFEDLLAFSFPK